jgi:signal transduction histidine kinase
MEAHLHGVIHDLTGRRPRRARLLAGAAKRALADISAMTARVAHDFGNPLAGLRMTAQRLLLLLGREPLPVDQMRRTSDMILATTERLDTNLGEFRSSRASSAQLSDIDYGVPEGRGGGVAAGGRRARHRARGGRRGSVAAHPGG